MGHGARNYSHGRRRRGGSFGFAQIVQSGNPAKIWGRVFYFGQIFITIQADGHTNLRFCLWRLGLSRIWQSPDCIFCPNDAQDPAPAAYAHILAERNFGGHLQSEFDLCTFAQRHIGEQKGTTGTKVLSEAEAFGSGCCIAQRDRKVESEALPDATFNANRGDSHRRVPFLRESPGGATATVAQSDPTGKAKIREGGMHGIDRRLPLAASKAKFPWPDTFIQFRCSVSFWIHFNEALKQRVHVIVIQKTFAVIKISQRVRDKNSNPGKYGWKLKPIRFCTGIALANSLAVVAASQFPALL